MELRGWFELGVKTKDALAMWYVTTVVQLLLRAIRMQSLHRLALAFGDFIASYRALDAAMFSSLSKKSQFAAKQR